MMYLSIGEKARECGVSIATLRRWDKRVLLRPDMITAGGHRRYRKKPSTDKRLVIAYARVSSYDQKSDLEKQKKVLSVHKPDRLLSDIGSGINFNKPGFKKLIQLLITYHSQIKKNFTYSKEEKEAAKKENRKLVIPTSSLSIRLMKTHKGDIDIGIGLNSSLHLKPDLKTHEKQGVIGIDINPDHLDIVETDSKGNYLKGWSVGINLNKKSTKQRKTILSQATKNIVNYALSKGKSVVLENLDFSKKKKALKDNYNKDYARMLSAFSYGKIKEYFTNQCWKIGVNLLFINPAFTSFLGNIKYGFKLRQSKTSSHTPAAYVIARRGQGFNERIPSSVIKMKKVICQREEILTGERIPLRKMVFSISSVKSWAKLVNIHKTLLKKVNLTVLSSETIDESNLLTEIKSGLPLYQEVYLPERLHDQVFITLK